MKPIKVNEEKPSAIPSDGSLKTSESDAAPSPRPWRVTEEGAGCAKCAADGMKGYGVRDANDVLVFLSEHDSMAPDEDNTELIVRAVNSHDALVAALKSVIAAHCPNDKLFCGSCSPARDVLSLVEGGQ